MVPIMWIFGGAKSRAKRIEGDEVQRHCDECGRVTRHYPVKVKDSFHVFFVNFADMNSRGLACHECGEIVTGDEAARNLIDESGLEELSAAPSQIDQRGRADISMQNLERQVRVAEQLNPRKIADPDALSLRRKMLSSAPVDHDRVDDDLARLKAEAKKPR
jgi:hypothetical protein